MSSDIDMTVEDVDGGGKVQESEQAHDDMRDVQPPPPSPAPPQESPHAPARPAARLMISKMVLKNFKSYAGIREIGPFHKVRLMMKGTF